MSLQLANIFLPLLFLLCLQMGAAENTTAVFVVNHTPPYIRAMEGSEFTVECTFNTSHKSVKWFVEWTKTKNNVTEKVDNRTDQIILSTDLEKRSGFLTVKKADITDSGTYVCLAGTKDKTYPGNGTQVTIDEITDLMVNQTPPSFSDFEGSELTMECTFKTINDSTMYVRWYNYGTKGLKKELVNDSDVITTLHLDNGFASLTLKNVNTSNTGTYMCEVGITARNLSGNGTGTQVTIEKMPELMVNQTPASIHESEGSDLTLECRFTVWNKHNTLYVKWYKHNETGGTKKELPGEGGWGSAAQDLAKGFASFTLKNMNVTNTGNYICEVGSRARNLSASGAGTQVTITPVDLLVNQTPALVNDEEGKQLTIECRFRALEKPGTKYSVKWYKKGDDGHEKELKNETGSVTTTLDFSTGLASLTLTKASMSDSGFYRCDFGKNGRGNGTRVTIHAVDLLVNQTSAMMNGVEEEKLTIECRFKVVKDSSTTYSVKWYKTGNDGHKSELKNGTGFVTTALDSSKGLASLTFIKINRNDSGLYRCDFGRNGVGNGTRVTIHAHDQSSYIVPGAVAGTLLFLLVLGILFWRWRQSSKEPPQSRSEAEMNDMEMCSPPPADDVTYADLNFRKNNAKAEEEVVYTEVKIQPKKREDNDIYAKVKLHHC